ncbi:MAG: SAM-dependent methyltransferase [Gammaproteobacteria bacterium]
MPPKRPSLILLSLGAVLSLQGIILGPDAAAQNGLVLLAGDGRLGAEADELRRVSSAYGYEGTPHSVVSEMIELAAVNEDDVAYEPGCGDARIVIAAVQAGANRGLGVDINPDLAEVCYARVKAAGLEDQIDIYWGNALDLDMSDVTAVFLFMGNSFNMVMRPMLWEQLPVGARVVSNDFHMRDWEPDRTVRVETAGRTYVLYLWTITSEIKERVERN